MTEEDMTQPMLDEDALVDTDPDAPDPSALSHDDFLALLRSKADSISLLSYDPSSPPIASTHAHRSSVTHLLESHATQHTKITEDLRDHTEHVATIMEDMQTLTHEQNAHERHIHNDLLQWHQLIQQREHNINLAQKALKRLSQIKQEFANAMLSDPSYALKQYHEQLKAVVRDLTAQLETMSKDKQKFEKREELWRKHMQQKDELLVSVMKREEVNVMKLRHRLMEVQQFYEKQQVSVHAFFEQAIMMNLNAHNCYEGYKLCIEQEEAAEKTRHAVDVKKVGGVSPVKGATPSWLGTDPKTISKLREEGEILQNETKLEKFLAQFAPNLRDRYVNPKAEEEIVKGVGEVHQWMSQREREAMVLTAYDLEEIMLSLETGGDAGVPYVSTTSVMTEDTLKDIEGRDVYGAGYSTYSPRGILSDDHPSLPYPTMRLAKSKSPASPAASPLNQVPHGNYNEYEKQFIQQSLSVTNQSHSQVEGVPLSHYSPKKPPSRSSSHKMSVMDGSIGEGQQSTATNVGTPSNEKKQSAEVEDHDVGSIKSNSAEVQDHDVQPNPREDSVETLTAHTADDAVREHRIENQIADSRPQRQSKDITQQPPKEQTFPEKCSEPEISPSITNSQPPTTPQNSTLIEAQRIKELELVLQEKQVLLEQHTQESTKTIEEQREKIEYLQQQMEKIQAQIKNAQQLDKKVTEISQKAESQKQIFEEQSRKKDEHIQQLKAMLKEAQQERKKGKKCGSEAPKPPRGGNSTKSKSSGTKNSTQQSKQSGVGPLRESMTQLDFEGLSTGDVGADPSLLLSPLSSATDERGLSSRVSTGRRATEELQTISEIDNDRNHNDWTTPNLIESTSNKLRKKKKKSSSRLMVDIPHSSRSISSKDDDDSSSRLSSESQFGTSDVMEYDEALLRAMEGTSPVSGTQTGRKYEYQPNQVGVHLVDQNSALTPNLWDSEQLSPLRRYTDVPVPIHTESGTITYTGNRNTHKSKQVSKLTGGRTISPPPKNSPPGKSAGGETFQFSTDAQIERVVDQGFMFKRQIVTSASDGSRRYLLQNPNVMPLHPRRESMPANGLHMLERSNSIGILRELASSPSGKPNTAPLHSPTKDTSITLRIPKERIRVHIRKEGSPLTNGTSQSTYVNAHHPKRHSLPVTQMEKLPPTMQAPVAASGQMLSALKLGGSTTPQHAVEGIFNVNLLERMRQYEQKHKSPPKTGAPANKVLAPLRQGEIGFNGKVQYG